MFENEGYARRTRPKLRQPIYCTGSCTATAVSSRGCALSCRRNVTVKLVTLLQNLLYTYAETMRQYKQNKDKTKENIQGIVNNEAEACIRLSAQRYV